MQRQTLLVLGLLGATAWWVTRNSASVLDAVQTGEDDVVATLAGWKQVQQGGVWVPVLNQTETQYGIPPDLLARMAYQESHFRPDIITGALTSTAGALGIMQLMPQYFTTVNVSRPYSAADTVAQISEAARQLASLYNQFQDWGLAVAAYNDGAGNLNQYIAGNRALPQETIDYVTAVLGDVPVASGYFVA